MPLLTASTPKYRKHRASGQAVVTIAGKDRYLGPYGTKASKIEYDRLVGEWLAAGRPSSPPAAASEITIAEICIKFYRHAELHYRKNGRDTGTADNFKPVLKLLKTRYGHTSAADFGPLALKAIREVLVKADNSRNHVNLQVQRIRRIFKWAAGEQLISPLVYQALGMVDGLRKGNTAARDNAPVLPVDDATVEATLPHLSSVVADMVRIQRLTGCRPGEVCALRPCDVDRSESVWKYIPAEHKTEHHGRQRTIFIGPKAQEVLLPYLLRDSQAHCFSPAESDQEMRERRQAARQTPLSCGNKPGTNRRRKPAKKPGDRYTKDSYARAITRACEIAFGMPKELRDAYTAAKKLPVADRKSLLARACEWRREHCWSPNQLRHAAATQIRKQFGLEAAQVTLGHSQANVTQVYAERDMDKAINVAREVG